MNEDIKKLFADVKKKKGEKVGANSLINIEISKKEDHYIICPFRSIDVEECPLCKLEEIGEI
jgi:hypothetical protein